MFSDLLGKVDSLNSGDDFASSGIILVELVCFDLNSGVVTKIVPREYIDNINVEDQGEED